jgi:hypothetical protein
MNSEEIRKLTPQERIAGFMARDARVAEIGCKLRSHKEDEEWTPEEEKEWDDACDDLDPWWYALSEEEHAAIKEIYLVFSQLARGEWPINILVQKSGEPTEPNPCP